MIHQVLVSASCGDAITNAAFELRSLLRRIGPSEIYTRYWDPQLAHEVIPLRRYRPSIRPEADVLLFHASIGNPDVMSFLQARPERLVLIYHNISPPESFRRYDPAFSDLLEQGRRDVASLKDRVVMALAVSPYNARELEAMGFREVRVSPLIIDVDRLRKVEPHAPTSHHLATRVEGPVILYVGQLLPHKRPDLLVQAYHALMTYLMPNAHLILVGPGRLARFNDAVRQFIYELNLPHAWLAGPVSDEELVSFYRRADVFVTASEHEGFCVPLIEAMAFDVPVVARANAAISETLAGAGLLLPAESSRLLMAEAIAEVLANSGVRATLAQRGQARLADFCPDGARAAVLKNLLSVT